MMKSFVIFAILMVSFKVNDAAPQMTEKQKMEMMQALGATICGDSISPQKIPIVAECEGMIPKPLNDIWNACIKEAMGVERTMPLMCYSIMPSADKLKGCLKDREAEAAKQGIVIEQQKKEEFRGAYMGCLAKTLQ